MQRYGQRCSRLYYQLFSFFIHKVMGLTFLTWPSQMQCICIEQLPLPHLFVELLFLVLAAQSEDTTEEPSRLRKEILFLNTPVASEIHWGRTTSGLSTWCTRAHIRTAVTLSCSLNSVDMLLVSVFMHTATARAWWIVMPNPPLWFQRYGSVCRREQTCAYPFILSNLWEVTCNFHVWLERRLRCHLVMKKHSLWINIPCLLSFKVRNEAP